MGVSLTETEGLHDGKGKVSLFSMGKEKPGAVYSMTRSVVNQNFFDIHPEPLCLRAHYHSGGNPIRPLPDKPLPDTSPSPPRFLLLQLTLQISSLHPHFRLVLDLSVRSLERYRPYDQQAKDERQEDEDDDVVPLHCVFVDQELDVLLCSEQGLLV